MTKSLTIHLSECSAESEVAIQVKHWLEASITSICWGSRLLSSSQDHHPHHLHHAMLLCGFSFFSSLRQLQTRLHSSEERRRETVNERSDPGWSSCRFDFWVKVRRESSSHHQKILRIIRPFILSGSHPAPNHLMSPLEPWSRPPPDMIMSMSIPSSSIISTSIVVTTVILHLCSSFNLEPRLPIVKRGIPNSYFGYSVAEHLIEDQTRRRIIEPV